MTPLDRAAALVVCARVDNVADARQLLDVLGLLPGDAPAPSGRPPLAVPLPREHGTERGYQQHRSRRERKCEPCLEAHAAEERAAYRTRRDQLAGAA